jgi:probable rRNA maturation factor
MLRKGRGEVTVSFVTDGKIRELNLKYLGKNNSTDVLAFDISAAGKKADFLAEIVISSDTAIRNATIYKTTPKNELYLYAAHGALHLAGFNDADRRSRMVMQRKAERIIAGLK